MTDYSRENTGYCQRHRQRVVLCEGCPECDERDERIKRDTCEYCLDVDSSTDFYSFLQKRACRGCEEDARAALTDAAAEMLVELKRLHKIHGYESLAALIARADNQ